MARLATLFLLFTNAFILGLLMVDSVMDERSFKEGLDTGPAVTYYQTINSSSFFHTGIPLMVVLSAIAFVADVYQAKSKIKALFTGLVLAIAASLYVGVVEPAARDLMLGGVVDQSELQMIAYVHLGMMVLGILNAYVLFSRLVRQDECEECAATRPKGKKQ